MVDQSDVVHWLLWDDRLPWPTATIVWDANLADVARELGRRVEGPFRLVSDRPVI